MNKKHEPTQKHSESADQSIPRMPMPSGSGGPGLRLLLGLVLLCLILIGGVTTFVYTQSPEDAAVRAIVEQVPYPAVLVNWQPITIESYLKERDALMKYYESAETPLEEGQEESVGNDVVETLVNKVAVDQLAVRYGITLDEARVEEMAAELTGDDDGAFNQQLKSQFGWTREEFEERVIKSIVLASQVSTHVAETESIQQPRREQMGSALERIEGGEAFADVATSISEQYPSVRGGDIGYVKISQLPETWKESVTSLEAGEHTGIVEEEQAFLVFKVIERVEAGEDSEVQLSAVVVPKRALQEVVDEYLSESTVWELI